MEDKISVVLATFNGEKYLNEQLDSIFYQSRKPDEVIIVDDCSTDNTQLLIKEYIKRRNLKTWILICNENNLGWKKNFKKGFDICSGDLIFPCDQDDIWHKDKIELMSEVMKKNLLCNVLVSNYEVFFDGEQEKNNGYKKIADNMKNDKKVEQIQFDEKWAYILRPGCSFCFRKSFYENIKLYWNTDYAHDAILWRIAVIQESLFLYNNVTMKFRRHGDNVTSGNVINRTSKISSIEELISVYNEYYKYAKNNNFDHESCVLKSATEFLELRLKAIERRSVLLWIVCTVKYHKHYLRLSSALSDLKYLKG